MYFVYWCFSFFRLCMPMDGLGKLDMLTVQDTVQPIATTIKCIVGVDPIPIMAVPFQTPAWIMDMRQLMLMVALVTAVIAAL